VVPGLPTLSQQLNHLLGDSHAAIHWDVARKTLSAADGMPTVVGVSIASADTAATHQASAAAQPPRR
jgi:hypothetical protein